LPCGAAPTKWRFLQRNRLIAAASEATVVLEAGIRSGSLNTAGHAAALGRPLGAVPGPVTSPASAGCHRLLREFDAVCVVDADQMAELAGRASRQNAGPVERDADDASGARRRAIAADSSRAGRSVGDDPDAIRALDAMSTRRARELPEVARRAGLTVIEAMAALGRLEAEGVVERRPEGWVRRRAG